MNFLLKIFTLIVMFHNFSMASDVVESQARISAVKNFRIPWPRKEGWEKLQKHLGLKIKEIDYIYVEIDLPQEWHMEENILPSTMNRINKEGAIYDHKNRKIGSFVIRDRWTKFIATTIFDLAIVDELIAEQTTAFLSQTAK